MNWLLSVIILFVNFNQALREEILIAFESDQSARQKVIETLEGSLKNSISSEIEDAILEIDQKHNVFIREVIEQFGWPGISLIEEDGSHAFWLLVQHQDFDIDLQVECLYLLEDAVNRGDASCQDLAFLVDRVRKIGDCLSFTGRSG